MRLGVNKNWLGYKQLTLVHTHAMTTSLDCPPGFHAEITKKVITITNTVSQEVTTIPNSSAGIFNRAVNDFFVKRMTTYELLQRVKRGLLTYDRIALQNTEDEQRSHAEATDLELADEATREIARRLARSV